MYTHTLTRTRIHTNAIHAHTHTHAGGRSASQQRGYESERSSASGLRQHNSRVVSVCVCVRASSCSSYDSAWHQWFQTTRNMYAANLPPLFGKALLVEVKAPSVVCCLLPTTLHKPPQAHPGHPTS